MKNLSPAAWERQMQANRKWNDEHLTNFQTMLPKELVAEFKARCKENGESQASVIKRAMLEYIG